MGKYYHSLALQKMWTIIILSTSEIVGICHNGLRLMLISYILGNYELVLLTKLTNGPVAIGDLSVMLVPVPPNPVTGSNTGESTTFGPASCKVRYFKSGFQRTCSMVNLTLVQSQ
jgi:hypothetical protein